MSPPSPRDRKRRTETTERGARLLLRELGHPASPSRGRLDTFPPAAPHKTSPALCTQSLCPHTSGEYGLNPSTGFSPPSIGISRAWPELSERFSETRVHLRVCKQHLPSSTKLLPKKTTGQAGTEEAHWQLNAL